MPLLTSWVGRNKIPYPVGTILSLMAREGTKFLPLAPSARGEEILNLPLPCGKELFPWGKEFYSSPSNW